MRLIKTSICVSLIASVSACGSFSPTQLNNDADAMRSRIGAQASINAAQSPKPLVEKMSGSYLGSSTIPLSYVATLPAVFRDKEITLNFPARSINGNANLTTVVSRITDVSKLPVRIQPDVFLTAKQLIKSKDESATANAPPSAGVPTAGMFPLPMGQAAGSNTTSAQQIADYDNKVPMEYTGTLAGYLDFLTARLGINWEYRDGGIVLFRLMTKTMPVKVSPGDHKYASALSKGSSGSATSGSATSGSSTGAGSFTSDTSSSVEAKYSIWTSMASAIEGMKTPVGHFTIDQAAGLVTITDTKQVVDEVSSYVSTVNSSLTRQVDVEVRVLTVSTTDSTQLGFDLNLLYSKINSSGAVQSSVGTAAPGSLVDAVSGNIGYSVISPLSRWAGSSIVLQAMMELGTIIGDSTQSATTTNRVPIPIANFTTEGYLASTTPASGSLTGSAGLPGLTPGQLTTGAFLNVLPTAFENGSVLLRLAFDDTVSKGMGVISSGNGPTFQQIQTPKFTGSKSDHSVGLKDGESMVLMTASVDRTNANNRTGTTGYSQSGSRVRETTIIVVTPRVRAGI